jgi:hypothetical protein
MSGLVIFLLIVLIFMTNRKSAVVALILYVCLQGCSKGFHNEPKPSIGGANFTIDLLPPDKITKDPNTGNIYLQELIKQLKNKKWSTSSTSADYFESHLWRPYVDMHIKLQKYSTIEGLAFRNKSVMYNLIPKKILKKYFMPQFDIDPDNMTKHKTKFNGSHWIIKPTAGRKGEGITVVKSYKNFEQFMKNAESPHILAKYIDKPLLLNNSNFVMRSFFILYKTPSVLKTYLIPFTIVRKSKLPFKLSKYNKDIHNLHRDNTVQREYKEYFPKVVGKNHTPNMVMQIKDIIHGIKPILTAKCFKNADTCYRFLVWI